MKRKDFFNIGMYLEGLRRLRLPGIIFFVILTLESILFPLIYVVEEYSRRAEIIPDVPGNSYTHTPMSVEILEVHPLMVISFFIIVPALTWSIFSFLNKRNSSDFYHSLPHSRLSIYLSTTASLITWVLGLILIPAGISRLFISFFPDVFSVVPGSYLSMIFGCVSASFFVMGVIVCAMCITGTVFTNIIVTGLLMFFPRYVALFMTNGVAAAYPLIPEAYVSKILSADINIITGLVMDGMFGYGEFDCITNTVSQIYTLCAGIFYLALGAVLFYRRKSESADRSAPSSFMQSIYRIAITMCICVPLCFVLFVEGDNFSFEDFFLLFIFYVGAVLVYFIYELITTRKWKNLLKALPGLAIVAILNVALVLSMAAITAAEKTFTPDPGEIEYIQIVDESPRNYTYQTIFEYAQNESSKVKITDPKAIEIVSESLKSTTEYFEEHDTIGNVYYGPSGAIAAETYTFKIKTPANTEYRNIRIKASDFEVITSALAASDDYAASWLLLPEAQKGTISAELPSYVTIETEDEEKLFELLKNEVKSLDFDVWYNFLTSNDIYGTFASVTYTTNGVTVMVPISAKLMPSTSAFCLEKVSEYKKMCENGDVPNFDELIKKDTVNISSINLYYMNDGGEYRNSYVNEYMIRENDDLPLLSECTADGDIGLGDSFFVIELYEILKSETDSKGFEYYSETQGYTVIMKATDDVFDVLSDYVSEESEEYYYKYVD